MSAAAASVQLKFTGQDKLSGVIDKLSMKTQSFAAKAEAGVARADRAFRKLTPAIGGALKQFLSFASAAAVSTAIVGGVAFSVNAVKDYETSLASLSAITGKTGTEFDAFRMKVAEVGSETKKSNIEVAKGFEIVASAKPELLASADALAEVTKQAIILSKASGDDLASSAESLTGVMNAFNFGAEQSNRVINVLAAGSVAGAANISRINESMKNFGPIAASANITLEESVALIEVMGSKSLFGAEAGTKLRGSVLKLQQAGVGYASGQFNINDALEEARQKLEKLATEQEKDAALLKMFGAENISTGKILLQNIGLFKEYTTQVDGTNIASQQAATNSATLTVMLDELKAAWINMVTGSNEASNALNGVKRVIGFVTENLDTIVSVGSKVLMFLAAWKAAIIVSKIALAAYNIALGINGALSGAAAIAIGQSTIALNAYKIATAVATGVQWLWNAATTAFSATTSTATAVASGFAVAINTAIWPITLIALAIAALIALITVIIKKYDEWGAALALVMGPLGLIINLVQSFRRNWDLIVAAFKDGGIKKGLAMIGFTLVDAILMPLQQMLELASRIPGLGDIASTGASKIASIREKIGVSMEGNNAEEEESQEEASVFNPQATAQELLLERTSTNNARVDLNVNDPQERVTAESDDPLVNINTTSTFAGA